MHVPEPMGIERLKEALEANEWDGGGEDVDGEINFDDLGADDEDEDGSLGFGISAAEMEMEMFGMKQAIYGGGSDREEEIRDEEEGDEEIEQLQAMMLKMQAVRGMSP